MLWMIVGCALSHKQVGLVEVKRDEVQLATIRGPTFKLHLGDDHKYIRHVADCQLWVKGIRMGNHLWVKDWKITDGGDGSAPYIGTLRKQGLQYVLYDLNSGQAYMLEKAGDLIQYLNQPIMVVGYRVSTNRLMVVKWKVLSDVSSQPMDK